MCNYCDAYSALVSEDNSQTTLQSEAAQLLKPSLEMMLGADSQATAAETAQSNEAALNQTLSLVVQELQTLLPQFANSEAEALDNMRVAFGDSFSAADASALLAAWQVGDFEALPTIAFLSAAELGSANGAYEAQTGTIYLSAEAFELYQNDIPTLVAIVAEEFGHHLDSVLNGAEDSQGDEGAIFAALVQGKVLSAEQLQSLQQEEDQVTIVLSGGGLSEDSSEETSLRTIEVEQNQTSQISFEDVTDTAGNFISGRSYGAGAWGDFNGDGLPDLWVNNHFGSGRNLFVNNGDGTFTDVVNQGGAGGSEVFLASEIGGDFHGVAWADFDNDGDQDLLQLVGGEGNTSTLGQENTGERSEPNRLYVNNGGVLRDQAPALGLSYNSAKAQTPTWLDYDNDGRLDLFHGSTQRADGLNPTTVFRQQANGQFEDVGATVLPENLQGATVRFSGLGYLVDSAAGSTYNLALPGRPAALLDVSSDPFANIASDIPGGASRLAGARDFAFADFNNDGLIDVYFARTREDRLFFNGADGLREVSDSAGISSVDTSNAVGVVAADFDNDMDVDIYVVRERVNNVNLPNLLFDNQGDGTFVAVANQGGAVSATEGVGDNATVADYDVDGFIDIFVTNGAKTALSGPQQLFRNQGNSHNWLQIDLVGAVSLTDSEGNVRAGTNRDGIGAQVYVTAGGVRQRRDQNGGVHKHSQDFQRLHFGLAQNEQVELIEVRWPSGVVQQLENVGVNQVLTITEQITSGSTPATAIEETGEVSLLQTSSGSYQVQAAGQGPIDVLFQGGPTGAFNGWQAIGAEEQTGGGYQLVWRHDGGQFGTWNIDSQGRYIDATAYDSQSIARFEPAFGQDFNGDGLLGSPAATPIEETGDVSLLQTSSGSYQVQAAGQGPIDVLFQGGPIGAFNGWQAIGAEEQTGGGYQLVWRHDGGQFGTWNIDNQGRYIDATAYDSQSIARFEPAFGQDFNGDSLLGSSAATATEQITSGSTPATPIEETGEVSLLQTSSGSYQVQAAGQGPIDVLFQGGPIGAFNGWQAIGAEEQTGGGYQLVWRHDSGQFGTWNIDNQGRYIDATAYDSQSIAQFEPAFGQDFNGDGLLGSPSDSDTGNFTDSADLLFSLRNGIYLEGVDTRSEDIVQYDGTNFSLFFDGSDVGLGGKGMNIDAFTVISDNEFLISFDKAMTLGGAGAIDDSDVVKFTATSLGDVTAGSFELYLDGSDVGLTKGEEDIDGLTGLSDGSLLISTQGPSEVPGASANSEDLLLFRPTSLGENTRGSWSVYFDGSDVGLGDDSQEYIDGIAVDASDKLLFSVAGNFDVPGLSGAHADVFGYTPSSTGTTTSGSFDTGLLFDGSSFGLANVRIDAISLALPTS